MYVDELATGVPADGFGAPVVRFPDDPPEAARDEGLPTRAPAATEGGARPTPVDPSPSLGVPADTEVREHDLGPDDVDDEFPPLLPRRRRGELEETVRTVLERLQSGEQERPVIGVNPSNRKLPRGALTPHAIGLAVEAFDPEHRNPSIGALTSLLNHWRDEGIASFVKEPFAFVDFTDTYRGADRQRALKDIRREVQSIKDNA